MTAMFWKGKNSSGEGGRFYFIQNGAIENKAEKEGKFGIRKQTNRKTSWKNRHVSSQEKACTCSEEWMHQDIEKEEVGHSVYWSGLISRK